MDKTADKNLPKEIADIVKFHAKGATAAALASAWIPGAGGTAAVVASAAFIWTMYGRIGAKIVLPMSSNVLKTLAFGIATNLAAYAVGAVVLSSALSFIPGLGKKGLDPAKLSEEDLKNAAKKASKDSDVKDLIKQARQEFKSKKNNGEFKGLDK